MWLYCPISKNDFLANIIPAGMPFTELAAGGPIEERRGEVLPLKSLQKLDGKEPKEFRGRIARAKRSREVTMRSKSSNGAASGVAAFAPRTAALSVLLAACAPALRRTVGETGG